MDDKSRKIAGIFTTMQGMQSAGNLLVEWGITPNHINPIVLDDTMIDKKIEPDGDGVAKVVVKDALIGSGIGTAGCAAMTAASMTLSVAGPVLGPVTFMERIKTGA